jgi:adenosylcobyric acid synthase
MIEEKTGKPVIGTLYYQGNLGLDEEDGLSIERIARFDHAEQHKRIKIVVPRLKYISNFTDFAPLIYEPDVEFKYSLREEDISSADLIIIPGSKNTVADLMLLRESGLEDCVKSAVKKGAPLIGVCGGYQMLGKRILDPHNVESSLKDIDGMGFLDTITTLDKIKTTCQVSAEVADGLKLFNAAQNSSSCDLKNLKGYEIHMGNTTGDVGLFKITRLNSPANPLIPRLEKGPACPVGRGKGEFDMLDGSVKGNVWGTYLHGIFDNDGLRTALLNSLRKTKGLPAREMIINYQAQREEAINKWADTIKNSIDICFILRHVGMEYCMKRLPESLK